MLEARARHRVRREAMQRVRLGQRGGDRSGGAALNTARVAAVRMAAETAAAVRTATTTTTTATTTSAAAAATADAAVAAAAATADAVATADAAAWQRRAGA
eukprot:2569743-Prymnesium_polylepis.1